MNIIFQDVTEEEAFEIFKRFQGLNYVVEHDVVKDVEVVRNIGAAELGRKLHISPQMVGRYATLGMPYSINNRGHRIFNYKECCEWRDKSVRKRNLNPNAKISDYAAWHREITKLIRNNGFDEGRLCGLTFKYMTKHYGIVWDQVKKDFKTMNGYYPPSTLQSAWWLQENGRVEKCLFDTCLHSVIKEQKRYR